MVDQKDVRVIISMMVMCNDIVIIDMMMETGAS